MRFDPTALRAALERDGEFRRRSRGCTARIRIETGDQVLQLRLVDGVVTRLDAADTGFDAYEILLSAPAAEWAEIMRPIPLPFHQDFWSSRFHHGFRIDGDVDLYSAYYGAIQRMGALMRGLANPVASGSDLREAAR